MQALKLIFVSSFFLGRAHAPGHRGEPELPGPLRRLEPAHRRGEQRRGRDVPPREKPVALLYFTRF